jgi:hypothetical protein
MTHHKTNERSAAISKVMQIFKEVKDTEAAELVDAFLLASASDIKHCQALDKNYSQMVKDLRNKHGFFEEN